MQFIVTPGTLDLCRNNPANRPIPLHLWRPSLEGPSRPVGLSHAFPLTSRESCNAIGQRYYGPVVLLVDGNCYSATDIFAAGFQDHGIGKVLGVSTNTGAGGANVWEHWLLNEPCRRAGASSRCRTRRACGSRSASACASVRNAGALLEDFGVVPDVVYKRRRATT